MSFLVTIAVPRSWEFWFAPVWNLLRLLIYLKQVRCLLEGGACLIEMMEERKREQRMQETWEGREPGSGEAGNSPGGCWPQADLVSPSGLQPALLRSLELSPSLGGSQAGCAPGLYAGAKGREFLPIRFLAGHPLTMKARLLERVPIGFLPAPWTFLFTLEKTKPSGRRREAGGDGISGILA